MATRTSLMEFQVPRITHEEVTEERGIFVIEPLDRGFGYTFGNSLRRVLLSSLEGAAVTSVKIEGVAHEFIDPEGCARTSPTSSSTSRAPLPPARGVAGDRSSAREEGSGVVKASDIEAPADLEILNPTGDRQPLRQGLPEVTLTIGRNFGGYLPAELNRGPEHTIGVIPVDSIFSPVRRVSYEVEAARVGQRTDYDKLTLDVDGRLRRLRDAIAEAAEILIRQLAIFTDIDKIEGFREDAEAEAEALQAHGMENFLIEELELGVQLQLPEARRHRDDR